MGNSNRSFSLVDHKVSEAEFFLNQLSDCGFNHFELQCFVSAFISSARSITFSLQAVLRDLDGFQTWYRRKQEVLRNNPNFRFFH